MSAAAWVGELALAHLDAAYNLGRWLLGNEQDAADAVHDAYLRAARSAHTWAGGNARAWWLAIVRNCCLARLSVRGRDVPLAADPAELEAQLPRTAAASVEDALEAGQRRELLRRRLQELPPDYRAVIVLREIEDLSYREIAGVLAIPIGTVMSRLARARAQLAQALAAGETRGL